MSINTNLIALQTQNDLEHTQSALATSIRRLSTGLRVNSAQDDPAGLAISSRMEAQLKGLEQAAANTSQGISMLQTADGALGGATQLLQNMRALAVEAANGTNSPTDLASIQAQMTELQANMQQIASNTQYNGINLLDGSLSNLQFQVGANAGQTISFGISNAQVSALGNYVVSLTGGAGHVAGAAITDAGALAATGAAVNNVQAQALTVQGNGSVQTINVTAGETAQAIAAEFNSHTNATGITATASTTATMSFATAGTQSFTINGQQITASWSSDYSGVVNAINQQTGLTGVTATLNGSAGITLTNTTGADIAVENKSASNNINLAGTVNTGTQQAPVMTAGTAVVLTGTTTATTVAAKVGGNISFSSNTGFAITSSVGSSTAGGLFDDTTANGSTLNTVGSINVTTTTGADAALSIIDAAMAQVNTSRGLLGALQNRFTATVSNLETAALDLTASLSTERDADFAGETTKLSVTQILQQAGTAMLAQANQIPNGVLALLR